MKKSEIKVGCEYITKVSNKLTTVRVDKIGKVQGNDYHQGGTHYDVTNLTTGRKTTFQSAAKFHREVPARGSKKYKQLPFSVMVGQRLHELDLS
jgi:hypothetical protein